MELRELSPDELTPASYNPRLPLRPGSARYRRLERSIAQFDIVQPIVWNDRTGHVVAGHQRLEIAKARGMKSVPCVVVNLSLEREKALNIALNNPAVGSDWDDDRLQNLLLELQQTPEIDATLTGFDADELQDLLMEPVPFPPEAPPNTTDNRVRVTLIIQQDQWTTARTILDDLARQCDAELHVQLPG